ncbi:MAG: prolyl oligopeptidase family serine peptidase [Anaerolineales bacterium]|nr:prolyl oligopeptidase family serine peptidase [Anaerolineales bacterium]
MEQTQELYHEPPEAGNRYREQFLSQVLALIEREFQEADDRRTVFFQPDVSSPVSYEASLGPYRQRLRAMLGWPLTLPAASSLPSVRELSVGEDALGRIMRMWIEVVPGLETYGLLFLPHGAGPHALVISQHGGGGTPELCSDFFGSANYNDMSRRVLRQGIAVFAPQLLRWTETFGAPHDFLQIDRWMKQLGGSLAALELLCLQRSVDALAARPDIDASRIGMIGLSYGGFHTLFAAALDTRIRVAISSCFFSNRRTYAWGDWVWKDAASHFFDAEVAALVCPRWLYVEVGARDELFDVRLAEPEAEKVRAVFTRLGIPERFVFRQHPGGHELGTSSEPITFLSRQLGCGQPSADAAAAARSG